MNRILVAGATGYLGGYVARAFKARGHHVRALARYPEKLDPHDTDEIVRAEITRPDSLSSVCDGMDTVFSSIGITRQKDGLTFRDVDYQGNLNLLQTALKAGVKKFIYVSVFNGPNLLHLDIVKAHEDFVLRLKASGIDYAVVRPTGYFSDMGAFLEMAEKGRVYLIGKGENKVNPIHGADLARRCVALLDDGNQEIDVGGPDVLTYRAIAQQAFQVLGKTPRITAVPVWTVKAASRVVQLFSRHQAGLLAFFTTAMTSDVVAPATGTHRLADYFNEIAST